MLNTLVKESSLQPKMEAPSTMKCGGKHGPSCKSPYPKTAVPVELFRKDPKDLTSPLFKKCIHCRLKEQDMYKKRREKKVEKYEELKILVVAGKSNVMYCKSNSHNSKSQSPYPRDSVPVEFMTGRDSDGNIRYYDTCRHCRDSELEGWRKNGRAKKDKHSKAAHDSRISNSDLIYCPSQYHCSKSIHPRNQVPKQLFRKEPSDPNSELYEQCVDCRIHNNTHNINNKSRKMQRAQNNGYVTCSTCLITLTSENKCLNKDGSESKTCIKCKTYSREVTKKLHALYKNIIIERIKLTGTSCVNCKSLYLKTSDQKYPIARFDTHISESGNRYIINDGHIYYVKDIVECCPTVLELNIIEMDHLTETEQRERGIIGENDLFVPKRCLVYCCKSEHAMRLEARKCQHLCSFCHITVTISREQGVPDSQRSIFERERSQYVNDLKKKGCSNCGYQNPAVPRFFEFDHIDPSTKTSKIADMVSESRYSMEDLLAEIAKCRILCKFCHKIHTQLQRREGKLKQKLNNQYSIK